MPSETEGIDRDGTEFRLALLERATSFIRESLTAGRKDDASRLYRGNDNDTNATKAALLSAWESFHKEIGDAPLEIEDITSLARSFIHLACKRMRRSDYQARRVAEQVSRANVRDSEGGFLPFDPINPAQRDEILKILPLEIEEVLGTRSPADRLVIECHLAGRTYKEIVAYVREALPAVKKLSQAGISRVVQAFRDEMRMRLRDD